MAQNSDALQEPSMDELLASIREIIEENTGTASPEGPAQNADNAARPAPGENAAALRARNYDAAMPNLKQDIRLRGAASSGNAAPMRLNSYNAAGPSVYSGGGDNGLASQPGQAQANGNGVSLRGHNAAGANTNNIAGRAGQPVQDSMNALAERIGLHRNNAAPKAEAYSRLYPSDNGAASLPPFIAPPAPNAAAGNNRSFSPAHNNWPQNGGPGAAGAAAALHNANLNGVNNARPRPVPASAPVAAAGDADFRSNNAALPNGFPAVRQSAFPAMEAKRIQPAPVRPPMEAERPGDRSLAVESLLAEKSAASADFGKSLPADVEHSTENLLRPVIAQWLDEHFRSLFEKILREEVQRFMQSMRRI